MQEFSVLNLLDKNLIKNDRELSKYSLFSLNKILHNLFSEKKINNLIQIGANDGKRFDTLNEFIKKHSPISIMVEPIKKKILLTYKIIIKIRKIFLLKILQFQLITQ